MARRTAEMTGKRGEGERKKERKERREGIFSWLTLRPAAHGNGIVFPVVARGARLEEVGAGLVVSDAQEPHAEGPLPGARRRHLQTSENEETHESVFCFRASFVNSGVSK